ncbi:uroporphyrinogen-III C-methyltransferase [Candidatus Sumerlaeota bacterium]
MSGTVYLVGAGPGDPGLISVKGAQCLRRADALIYDYLANEALLAYAPPECELVYVGKKAGAHTLPQEGINELLLEKARQHKVVVRLKGGDPFVFGRGGEEAEALAAAGIAFEIVPGITAGIAGSAYAGIPVTHRDLTSTVTFVTGHERATAEHERIPWARLAQLKGTLVFYMGLGNLPYIVERLTNAGLDPRTPAAIVQSGTYPRQRTVTALLSGIVSAADEAGLEPPAIIIIGRVVELRRTLNWFERRPLFGRRILVTRSRTQASDLLERLRELGAEPLEFPMIRTEPPEQPELLHEAVERSGGYDWVVFTSVNAVEAFMAAATETGHDVRVLGRARLAAIGPATCRALEALGLKVALTPQRHVAEELLKKFHALGGLRGQRILIPRAAQARDVLPDGLREAGATVDIVTAYRTVREKPDNLDDVVAQLREGRIDAVTFSSSSTARNFAELVGHERFVELAATCCLASIGPITSKTIRELGAEPTVEAQQHTIAGLLESLIERFGSRDE